MNNVIMLKGKDWRDRELTTSSKHWTSLASNCQSCKQEIRRYVPLRTQTPDRKLIGSHKKPFLRCAPCTAKHFSFNRPMGVR
jgi:hypothetical protein